MTTPNDLPSVGTEDAPSMANYTFTIVADSGYESTTKGRCSAKQYGAVIYALHNDDSYADQRDKLASERDTLAARVRELEVAAMLVLAWYEAEENHGDTTFMQRVEMCRKSEDALRAALSTTTPESKP